MAKWIAVENVGAGLRHAVICLNVAGRTKERTPQSKRARADSLAIVDKPQMDRSFIIHAFLFCIFRAVFI